MQKIEFEFANGTKVTTRLGVKGYIDAQMNEAGRGKSYLVKTDGDSNWMRSDEFTAEVSDAEDIPEESDQPADAGGLGEEAETAGEPGEEPE